MTAIPEVGTVGVVTSGMGMLDQAYYRNSVGGTEALPVGSYRVVLTRWFDDYETGIRMIGKVLDGTDTEVYFAPRNWTPDG